ncbi:MAG: wax ester/triacylglycerol synthase domain-containing protein [Acidimicrobiia bacterium]
MRMSDMEAVMWAVEKDPALRSDFTVLTILDRVPTDKRLKQMAERAIAAMPRLGQRVRSTPFRLAPPRWEDDPEIDLDYHIRRVAIPPPGEMRQLLDAAAQLAATPFDRSRPLWEFTLFEGLVGGKAGLLEKMHHTITDGVGGLKLSLALVDFERNPRRVTKTLTLEIAEEERLQRVANPIPQGNVLSELASGISDAVATQARRTRSAAAAGAALIAHPEHFPSVGKSMWNMLTSVQRQVIVGPHGYSRLFAQRSLGRRYDVTSVPFDRARETASATGVTVNDLFVTAITRAIGMYHEQQGESLKHLRMAMPVNLRRRPGNHGANSFAPIRVVLPVILGEVRDALAATHDVLGRVQTEPVLEALGSIAGAASALPTSALVSITRQQTRSIDFTTSNLRGAPQALYMAGALMEHNIPLGPRANAPVNVTVMSYAGSLEHGIHTDPAAVTNPEAFVACIETAWSELFNLVSARQRKRSPRAKSGPSAAPQRRVSDHF